MTCYETILVKHCILEIDRDIRMRKMSFTIWFPLISCISIQQCNMKKCWLHNWNSLNSFENCCAAIKIPDALFSTLKNTIKFKFCFLIPFFFVRLIFLCKWIKIEIKWKEMKNIDVLSKHLTQISLLYDRDRDREREKHRYVTQTASMTRILNSTSR
jgi:hypothetical protein